MVATPDKRTQVGAQIAVYVGRIRLICPILELATALSWLVALLRKDLHSFFTFHFSQLAGLCKTKNVIDLYRYMIK
jgi:hypothetical protein